MYRLIFPISMSLKINGYKFTNNKDGFKLLNLKTRSVYDFKMFNKWKFGHLLLIFTYFLLTSKDFGHDYAFVASFIVVLNNHVVVKATC